MTTLVVEHHGSCVVDVAVDFRREGEAPGDRFCGCREGWCRAEAEAAEAVLGGA